MSLFLSKEINLLFNNCVVTTRFFGSSQLTVLNPSLKNVTPYTPQIKKKSIIIQNKLKIGLPALNNLKKQYFVKCHTKTVWNLGAFGPKGTTVTFSKWKNQHHFSP